MRSDTIEFLTPDARAFGDVGPVDIGRSDDDWQVEEAGSRSRLATTIAAIGVTALLAGGVVAAAPWRSDPPNAVPTASINAASERTGWLLDPVPAGMRILDGRVGNDEADDGSGRGAGWGEVWATPGATRTSGSWFSLTMLPELQHDAESSPWSPVEIDGRQGFVATGVEGVMTVEFDAGQTDTARLVTITSFGWSTESLVALASSIGIVEDRPALVDDRPEFLRPELLIGLSMIAAGATNSDLVDRTVFESIPLTSVWYGSERSGKPSGETIMIQDHGVDPPDPQLAALAFTPVGHLPEGWGAAADFTGADLTLGSRTIDGTRVLSANWRVVDSHLTVTTTFGLVELLDLLSIAKRSTPNEWMALEQRVAHLEPHGGPEVNADVDR